MRQGRAGLLITLVFVGLTTIGLYRQLLGPEGFDSRDHLDFYLRVTQYQKEFQNGHWPQTLPDAVAGGGHAFPRFYPPASHFTAAGMSTLLGDAVQGTHWSVLLATVLSVTLQGMLIWRLTHSLLAVLLSVLVFATFPYRFIQLYLRGAFAEAWNLAVLPAFTLGAVIAAQDERAPRWWAIVIALMILSHAVMTLWVLPAILGLVALALPRNSRRPFVGSASLMTVWGAGLAAFYLLPMWRYLPAVRVWDPQVMRALPEHLAMSSPTLYLGFPAWAILGSLAGLTLTTGIGAVRSIRHGGFLDKVMWGAITLAVAYVGVILAPEVMWRYLPLPLRMIQFPFRLLGPIVFASALTVGLLVARHQSRRLKVGWAVLAGLLVVSGWSYGGVTLVPRTIRGQDLTTFLSGSYPDRGLSIAGEYLPRGEVPADLSAAIRTARENVGSGALESWDETEQGFHATIVTDRARSVTVPLVYDEYLDVRDANGTPIKVAADRGILSVRADSGRTEVLIARRWPVALKVGLLISFGATLILFVPRRRLRVTCT